MLDAQDEMQNQGSPLPRPASASAPVTPAEPAANRAPAPAAAGPSADPGGGVVSPIAGTVLEIKCKVGDQVTAGQTLLVIEAMKMETAIAAPAAGRVKAVPVAPGDSVRENQMLVEFE